MTTFAFTTIITGGGGGRGATFSIHRVPTPRGNGRKIPCQGKHREFGNVAKTQGIWYAQVVISLILKVKDVSIFAVKISIFSEELDKAVLCM